MNILVNVVNQKMKVVSGFRDIVEGSQEFVRFEFNLTDEWSGLMTFAQFRQGENAYNKYLDENNCVCLPPEIKAGTCTVMLYGAGGTVIGTTNYVTLNINEYNLVTNSQSTEISESLYTQLVTKVNTLLTWNEQQTAELTEADRQLQIQINEKAAAKDLEAEIIRAKSAEQANKVAIELKASQKQVDDLELKVTELQNNEYVAGLIEEAVVAEMNEYLASGALANMTIADASITRAKVNAEIEAALQAGEKAMQPSVYDPQGLKVDIYSYAQGRADTVQQNLNKVKEEIQDAYKLTDTVVYQNLGDAVRGAVTLSRNYAQALLADYKAFTIKVVDELPVVGENQTFYLLPNESGTGYDKYWWITDNDGNSKWDVFGSSSTLVVEELPEVGDSDVDYILKSSAGCLYYKYIDGYWEVVAGSLAFVGSALPDAGNEFTDYYILNASGSYEHYRFINGSYHGIGGNAYTRDEVDEKIAAVNESIKTVQNGVDANAGQITANASNITALSRSLDRLVQDFNDLDTEGYTYYANIDTSGDNGAIFTLYQVKGDVEEIASQFVIPAGGGGGGQTSTTNLVVDKITASPLVLTPTDKAEIAINYSSTDSDGEEVDGTYTWKIGSEIIASGPLVQGVNTYDLTEHVKVGTQKLTLTVVDAGGSIVVKSWTVQVVDVRLASTFNDRTTFTVNQNATFSFTPYGAVSKTVHFILDGEELEPMVTTASGTPQSYTIPAQTHGAHLLECYITATVNNKPIETQHIYKDIVWLDPTSDVPVIRCIYRNDYYGDVKVRQYDTLPIEYSVFDPTTNYPVVQRYVNSTLSGTENHETPHGTWNFKSDTVEKYTLTLECRGTSVSIVVDVQELGIDVAPVSGNLEVDFNPSGMTNTSADRVWSNGTYGMTLSDNFDWANGGYQVDENGDTYFSVRAGTRCTLDYHFFGNDIQRNPSTQGAEMKIVFMVENVQDINAVWMTNYDPSSKVGIQMNAHNGWLKTNNALESDSADVVATNTYLYMPYSEEDIIEMDINIDVLDQEDDTAQAFAMSYEDGVPSKAFVYGKTDNFFQYNSQPIVIGSDYCDVRIYRLKIYSAALTTEGIMRNFIADSRDSTTMLDRYDRNCIYFNRDTNEYTPYSGEGVLDPEKLAPMIPNAKVLMLETDHFTTSKKAFVKANLRCIHAPNGTTYPGDPYYDNWYFENGWHSGQGTTSDNYGNSSRNVDFLFNCDGTHKPSDKVDAEPGYVSKVTLGYKTEDAYTEAVTDWKGDEGKIALTRTSIPNNFFNLKVNVASSENVNNALLAKRYNDYLPYISPAKKRNENTKNTMEFVPAVLFLRETNPDISTHNEFLDTEWHFYSIGNIGDSKKTDYTRAYDPEDMNEFVIEISDNTKNNAIFQSGVYLDEQGNRQIEDFTITESEDDGEIIQTPVSIAKPSSFVYPITMDEWDNAKNMRRWCLDNEGFDGDHSFEPRYACCGDYRDGKLVNDTTGRGKAQVAINNNVWRAFYRWVVTSTDEEFVNELDQWCVRSAVEFFYAFTHRYTMMDNRAKNTFWHFAKTGVFREVTKPVVELLHVYCEKVGDDYVTTADTSIDTSKTYYTEYAFDLWDYDNDTALGIDNNGSLSFPYGREDHDYNIEGNPASGYVFNGAQSTFWCRLRDLLPGEITSTFNSVEAECFSASNLINEFDAFQECYPEELWRLDVTRKYIRTFTGLSVDNSKPKHDTSYLGSMMQGRKKYQRRQWERDQEMYFGTMNLMNNVVGDSNRITFRCFTPSGDDIAVKPDYTLRMVPFSDMYLSVMFGNGNTRQVRAKAGQEYTIECPLSFMDDTQVTIYGANRIQALNDLSACYIAANNFSMATKLRKLVVGNTTEGYSNPKLTSLTLGSNKLLQELDIRNCENLTGALNLSQCSNLVKLLAEGTSLTGVTFATNGKVETAHLPDTVNTLIMRNLNNLTDFQMNLDSLETLTLQGGAIDGLDLINQSIDTLRVMNLYDIDWTLPDTTLLNEMLDLFYSMVTGKVYVSGAIRQQELLRYEEAWDDLTVSYNTDNIVTQYLATYVNADGEVLREIYVDRGALPPDPVELGLIATPTMASTAQYNFTFSGWDGLDTEMLAPRTITATYATTVRTYTVTWYARAGLPLTSVSAEYGADVTYPGETPTNTSEESTYVYNLFAGWNKSTGYITGDTDVYAIWDRAELPAVGKDMKDMTPGELFAVTSSGKTANYFVKKDYIDIAIGHDFAFENVESQLLAENHVLDGTMSTVIDTGIKLFGEDARSFTLAISYKYNDTTADGTIVSCFEYDGSEGFRLRYNNNPGVQWGDKNVAVGYQKQMEMLVVRWNKDDPLRLHVYAYNEPSAQFSNAYVNAQLLRSRATSSEATLILGGFRFLGDGVLDGFAKGKIHWCKIWFDDLGHTNSQQLASWPHETWRAEYGGTGCYYLAPDGTSQKTNATFILNNLVADRTKRMNPTNTNAGGWDKCEMRTFLNEKLIDAFPTAWRTMLKQVKVNATAGEQSHDIVVSKDFVHLAARQEIEANPGAPYYSEGSYIFNWYTNDPSRIKFQGLIVKENPQFFQSDTDPRNITTNNVQEGDIWRKSTESNRGYMLVDGEWVAAINWWERSPRAANSAYFCVVGYTGWSASTNLATSTYGVCPCFHI